MSFVINSIYADASPEEEQAWQKRDTWVEHAKNLEHQVENLRARLTREQDQVKTLSQQLHDAREELGRLSDAKHQLARELESSAVTIKGMDHQLCRTRETHYRLKWVIRHLSSQMNDDQLEQLHQQADEACRMHFQPVLEKFGLTYDGDVLGGMRHGYGSYAGSDYEYTGNWEQDLPHGDGFRKRADGTTEKGEFLRGVLAKGVRILPDGIQEDGTFSEAKLAIGKRQWPDGRCEQGTFLHGILAQGRRQGLNGHYEEGRFIEGGLAQGVRRNEDCVEQGEFSMGALHGDGRRTTLQGHLLYEGRFVRGLLHGKGLLQIWEWDCPVLRITGNFSNGKANGENVRVEYFNRETRQADLTMTGVIIENVPKQVCVTTCTGTEFSGELAASGYQSLIREQPMSLHINRFSPVKGRGRGPHGEFEVRNGLLIFQLSHERTKTAPMSHDHPDRDTLWFSIDEVKLNFANGISLELKNEEVDRGLLPREFKVCLNGHRYGCIKPPSHFASERRLESLAALLGPGLRRKLMPQRLKHARDMEKHDEILVNGEPWFLLRGETPAGREFVLRLRKDLTECELA